jgi:hypothetical protein
VTGTFPYIKLKNPVDTSRIFTTYFNILRLCILSTKCNFMFHIFLNIKSVYFPKQY